MGDLNFGNEPGLESKFWACGPSVYNQRRGAFLGITRGFHAAHGGSCPDPRVLMRSKRRITDQAPHGQLWAG